MITHLRPFLACLFVALPAPAWADSASADSASITVDTTDDADHDGMPFGWEAANGFSDGNAADGLLDSDGDGFTNAQEYLAGTNPRSAASRLKAEQWSVRVVPGTGGHEFTVAWAPVAGHTYTVERSFDAEHWVPVATGVQATPPLNTLTDTVASGEGKAFYRIKAQ